MDAFSASVTRPRVFLPLCGRSWSEAEAKTLAACDWFTAQYSFNSVHQCPLSPLRFRFTVIRFTTHVLRLATMHLFGWLASGVLSWRKAPARLSNACHLVLPRMAAIVLTVSWL